MYFKGAEKEFAVASFISKCSKKREISKLQSGRN